MILGKIKIENEKNRYTKTCFYYRFKGAKLKKMTTGFYPIKPFPLTKLHELDDSAFNIDTEKERPSFKEKSEREKNVTRYSVTITAKNKDGEIETFSPELKLRNLDVFGKATAYSLTPDDINKAKQGGSNLKLSVSFAVDNETDFGKSMMWIDRNFRRVFDACKGTRFEEDKKLIQVVQKEISLKSAKTKKIAPDKRKLDEPMARFRIEFRYDPTHDKFWPTCRIKDVSKKTQDGRDFAEVRIPSDTDPSVMVPIDMTNIAKVLRRGAVIVFGSVEMGQAIDSSQGFSMPMKFRDIVIKLPLMTGDKTSTELYADEEDEIQQLLDAADVTAPIQDIPETGGEGVNREKLVIPGMDMTPIIPNVNTMTAVEGESSIAPPRAPQYGAPSSFENF